MKAKFTYLTLRLLQTSFKSKSFIITNIFFFLVILILFNLPSIILYFNDNSIFSNDPYVIQIEKNEELPSVYDDLLTEVKLNFEEAGYKISFSESIDEDLDYEISYSVENEKLNFVVKKADDFYATEKLVSEAINKVYDTYFINTYEDSASYIEMYNENLSITTVYIDTNDALNENDDFESGVAYAVAFVIVIVIFFIVLFGSQLVSSEIILEKDSKFIEIILSNVDAKTHLTSKILGAFLYLLVQGLLIMVYSAISLLIAWIVFATLFNFGSMNLNIGDIVTAFEESAQFDFSRIVEIFVNTSLVTIPIVMLSLVLYMVLSALFASMSSNIQEFQQNNSVLMIFLLIPFYIGLFSGSFEANIVIKIMGYIPLFSGILAPVLYANGSFTGTEYVISMIILLVFLILFIKIALPIYKDSLLDYSGDKLFKKIKRAIQKNNK